MGGLVIEGLSKTYDNGTVALASVDLQVEHGLYGLLGPNGAGKSTLMRTIATLQTPDSGSIRFNETDVLADPAALRRELGYLPQSFGAYPGVSGRALLDRFAWLKGITDAPARASHVAQLLDRVNLADAAGVAVSSYSGGMLRRFGIAVALIGAPKLLIVDEPTAGLDPAERNRFHRILADLADEAVVLLSTHIVEDIESLCPRLAILEGGRILAEGTADEMIAPLKGKLWQHEVPRDADLPEDALSLVATTRGVRITRAADAAPEGYTARDPVLEDVYHLALQQAGSPPTKGHAA